MTRHRKSWTTEEEEYLEDQWGVISYAKIAKKLGRTINGVKIKANNLNLGDPRHCYNGLTLIQLSDVIGVRYSALKYWIEEYDFPVITKVLAEKSKVKFVRIEDFWKWAEQNKEMIDFSLFGKNMLGAEKEWVELKRVADEIKGQLIHRSHGDAWTKEEDGLLINMVNTHSFTYPQIADRIKRSQGAIKRRLQDLDLQARPISLNNHIKYTEKDISILLDLVSKGHSMESIGAKLNKSALGIRGKLERMGYRFKNGVPYKREEGEGNASEKQANKQPIKTC